MQEWNFYNPEFVFKKDLTEFTWSGHLNFIYDLVRNTKPSTLAELGTYKGTSAMGISQGVLDEKLDTKLFFVDSWEGDIQTGNYDQLVYEEFLRLKEKYFSGLNITPLKMLFDDALPKFEDATIDILHIDGLHTYEGVKHDYDTWRPKVKDNGIIIFHDIRVPHFGVKDLWAEIKKDNPGYTYLEFDHNYGLGIMFMDESLKPVLTDAKLREIYDYYTDISMEFQLRQRIVELGKENERVVEECNAEKRNSGNTISDLESQLKSVQKEKQDLEKKYDRKLIHAVLRFYSLINRQ